MRSLPLIVLTALVIAGCARPEAVREVARTALPVATQLETSARYLERRLALQRRGFAERNADFERQALVDREAVELQERELKLRGDGDRLRRLMLLRDRDDVIHADPLAPLAEPAVAPIGENPVATKDLKSAIATLDRLTGAKRTNAKELLGFAKSVGDELDRIKAESDAKTN